MKPDSFGVDAQEGCWNGPVGDAPSGRDAAWGAFTNIL